MWALTWAVPHDADYFEEFARFLPSVSLPFWFMGWTDVVTALGTAGAAIGAVIIAWYSGRQAHKRIEEDRERSRRREQFAEAYAVQVVQGERPAVGQPVSDPSVLVLVGIVVNRGAYSITDVEVRFCLDGESLLPAIANERLWSFRDLPEGLYKVGDKAEERAMKGVLTPWDAGMRSESAEVDRRRLKAHYALVRWTDQWDQGWEHKLGKIEKISRNAPWRP